MLRDVVSNFLREAAARLQAARNRGDKTIEAFAARGAHCCLPFARNRRRDCQPEVHEQPERFIGDLEVPLDACGLPRQLVEATGEGRLAQVQSIRRQERFQRRLDNRRTAYPLVNCKLLHLLNQGSWKRGIPDTAVTMIDGGTAVFVPVAGGYKVRPVTVGGGSGGESVLTSGLAPGEEVVVSGTSALKALALGR